MLPADLAARLEAAGLPTDLEGMLEAADLLMHQLYGPGNNVFLSGGDPWTATDERDLMPMCVGNTPSEAAARLLLAAKEAHRG